MVNVVVTGHGGRGVGTSTGSYLVPGGVTIYFFTKDGQLLNSDGSDVIMDTLCTNNPDEEAVRRWATEIKREYETVPNYICYGTNDFRDPSGVYMVGATPAGGPMVPIPNGTEKRLSDIIGGAGKGVIGSVLYWLCCRDKPQATNNIDISEATSLTDVGGITHVLGGDVGASDMGVTPSQVKRVGKWI